MEATKRSYLKPGMNQLQIITEGVLVSASRAPIDVPVLIHCFNISNNSYLDGGNWSALADENFTQCLYTNFKNGNTPHADQLEGAGFLEGDCLVVKRATSTECINNNNNQVTIMVTRVDCQGHTIGTRDCQ